MNSHLALAGRNIAIPESRQLDILAQLLERRGAGVMRVPLIAIHDAPDPGPVLDWIRRFIAQTPDLFIILTGEGVKRLLALAGSNGLDAELIEALGKTRLLCRGPKPDRVLRGVGRRTDIPASAPTTAGVIATLDDMDLKGRRIAVQLYGDDPNTRLIEYLQARQAIVDTVSPYIYADQVEDEQVVSLIRSLAEGRLDAIAFTSQPQFRRLLQVARKSGLEESLKTGLSGCCVAAVGPVVAGQLREHGVRVDLVPSLGFFMKPLVSAIVRHFDER